MRFMLMLHMPQRTASATNAGTLVHQLFVEHPTAKSLLDFVNILTQQEFVIVKELYKDPEAGFQAGTEIAINYRYIAKLRLMD